MRESDFISRIIIEFTNLGVGFKRALGPNNNICALDSGLKATQTSARRISEKHLSKDINIYIHKYNT